MNSLGMALSDCHHASKVFAPKDGAAWTLDELAGASASSPLSLTQVASWLFIRHGSPSSGKLGHKVWQKLGAMRVTEPQTGTPRSEEAPKGSTAPNGSILEDTMAAPDSVRVHVLGRLTLSNEQSSFDERDLPGVQGTILLAFLVLERNQASRQALADMLWKGQPPGEWNTALSSLTSKIRSLLDQVNIGRGALVASAGTLELVLPSNTWVDCEAATIHLDRARRRQDPDQDSLADATAAWSILKRPFLAGVDSQWADTVRRDLDRRRYEACEVLSHRWRVAGDPTLAFTLAESAIELDPLRESGYRLAMEASLATGDRALAAQVLAQCRHVLNDELDVEPSSETLDLLRPDNS